MPPVMVEILAVVQEEGKLAHRNECNDGSSNMCQRQYRRLWKRQSRWHWSHMNECKSKTVDGEVGPARTRAVAYRERER